MTDLDEAHRHLATMQEHVDAMQRDIDIIRRYARHTEIVTVAALVLALGLGIVIAVLAVLGWR